MVMRFTTTCLVAALAMLAFGAAAFAQPDPQDERILDYHSDVTVQPDGGITVKETIRVQVAGIEIKHGILRDIPMEYVGRKGGRLVLRPQVTEVLLDGARERFVLSREGTQLRIRIGRADRMIAHGEHTYAITYRADRMIGFFQDHDELYWNVTGNAWMFPIDRASATVTLPSGAEPNVKAEAYTGARGDKGTNYRASVEGGRATLETLEPMPVGHGLTICVSWPKGVMAEPTRAVKWWRFVEDSGVAALGVGGVALVFLYYFIAWLVAGRDPCRGTIIPRFEPPRGLSPATMRYLMRMGYDAKCLAAAVIDMAVRGFLRIDKGLNYVLKKTPAARTVALPEDEKAVGAALFEKGQTVEAESSQHERFSAAETDLQQYLSLLFKPEYFLPHQKLAVAGTILSAVVMLSVGLCGSMDEFLVLAFFGVWLGGWSVGLYGLLLDLGPTDGGGNSWGVFIPVLAGEILAIGLLVWLWPIWLVGVLLALIVLNILFYRLLRAPTREGRRAMDEIEGFRMYLATAEGDRLNQAGAPENTLELFERYLPYALALGVENQWAERFSDVLAAAGQDHGQSGYSPHWYSDASHGGLSSAAFASALGGSFAGALSSAASAPGSSSGSSGGGGGGGSSGGGGGGGGGGGW